MIIIITLGLDFYHLFAVVLIELASSGEGLSCLSKFATVEQVSMIQASTTASSAASLAYCSCFIVQFRR